jgi:hypothetical protein
VKEAYWLVAFGPTISEEDPTIGAVSRSVQERFEGMGCLSDEAEVIVGMAYVSVLVGGSGSRRKRRFERRTTEAVLRCGLKGCSWTCLRRE